MADFKLYGRKYKLSVLTQRNAAISFDADIHFTFSIDKNMLRYSQIAEITIHNLSPNTETDILKNGAAVALEVGYDNGAYGKIFAGPIRQAIRGKEDGTTYFLRLVCIDGDDPLNLGLCSLSVTAGTTVRKLAEQIARSSTIPFDVKVDPVIGGQQLQKSAAVFGKPGDALRNIALNNNAAFYYSDGSAYVSQLSKGPPASVVDLNAQSGMVGMPTQTDQGIKVKCLINPNLKLDSWFHLNNKSIIVNQLEFGVPQTLLDLDGIYRIVSFVASGDTRGNDWYMDIEAISQTGSIPAMLVDPSQNGM